MFSICFSHCIKLSKHEKNPQRIPKIKPFIDQYDWKEIDFPAEESDWKKFELNNEIISLNILFVPYNTEEMRAAYKSKYDFKHVNQAILLMITDGKKWHYLAVKRLPVLLRGITSNHNGEFYCLNCFHSYRTEKNSNSMKEYVMLMIFVM